MQITSTQTKSATELSQAYQSTIKNISPSIASLTGLPHLKIENYLLKACIFGTEQQKLTKTTFSKEQKWSILKYALFGGGLLLDRLYAFNLFKKACDHDSLDEDLASLLIPSIDSSLADNKGKTALHIAAYSGHTALVSHLIASGAEKNQKNNKLQTPLQLALKNNHIETAIGLVDLGADTDFKNKKGNSPLHKAAKRGQLDLVKALTSQKSGTGQQLLNVPNSDGDTPLSLSIVHNYFHVTDFLINLMAKTDASSFQTTNKFNFSPLELVKAKLATKKLTQYSVLKKMDNGFTKEIRLRSFIAHLFGLEGETQIGTSSIPLEGGDASIFLKKFYRTTKLRYKETIEKLSSCSYDSVKTRSRTAQVKSALQKVIEALKDCKNRGRHPSLLDEYDTIAVAASWSGRRGDSGHLVGFVSCDGKIARCNKGDRTNERAGVSISKVRNKKKLLPALKKVMYANTMDYFCSGIEKELGLKEIHFISQKDQKVGNCSLASLHSMRTALVYLHLEPSMGSKGAEILAKELHKEHRGETRIQVLEEYLALHTDAFPFPMDKKILSRIYHKDFHCEKMRKRVQTLLKDAIAGPQAPIADLSVGEKRRESPSDSLPTPPKRKK